jgi:hypothetical protein
MLDRQRIATLGITTTAAATLALAVWLKPWKAQDIACPTPPQPVNSVPAMSDNNNTATRQIDVVFAIDTTGSMGGLLDSAKRAVWSIAGHIRQVNPQADLRVGLVAYRDIHDEYITKDFPLSADMDAVYTELSSYVAAGGDDTPEDVDAGLYDAVHKMAWRPSATKLMFLVGDAPPATRGDVPAFDVSAREAGEMGIHVNAIRCGNDPDTEMAWRRVATLGHGEFSTIAEDGGVVTIATPYDGRMAELSAQVDRTTVVYGTATVRHAYQAKIGAAMAAPAPEAAARAEYYVAKKGARVDEDVLGKDIDTNALDKEMLPDDLAKMSQQELGNELARRTTERDAAQRELTELAAKRKQYLDDQAKTGGPRGGLDVSVDATIDALVK